MLSLLEGSEPFFRPGGPVGCLLIHGFTGTPYEMRGLGDCLASQGYTVLAPRLAHHGTNAADMNRSRWWDWYNSTLDGWHLLNCICDQVFVIGLSMGGLTALMLAANQPVAGVVAMSTPGAFHAKQRQLLAARYFWWLRPLLNKPKNDEDWPSYNQYPVRAAGELRVYLGELHKALPKVNAPALLMHATGDTAVSMENLAYIYDRIGSPLKKKVLIERGGHVMTEDVDKNRVYHEVIDFLVSMAA
jgi:carboxylesterase